MRTLFSWEWGAGHGHLSRFAPLAAMLVDAGHSVTIATRELDFARRYFMKPIELLPAPVTLRQPANRISSPQDFADLAWNLGFSDRAFVEASLEVWHSYFTQHSIDLAICDFGVAAPSVASALSIPIVRIGTGFVCPPLSSPLPRLRSSDAPESEPRTSAEGPVLDHVNSGLRALGLQAHASLSVAMGSNEMTLLGTVPELDHYERDGFSETYLGIWDVPAKNPVMWQTRAARRVVAYLKPFHHIKSFLRCLTEMGYEIALVPDGINHATLRDVQTEMTTIQAGHVDISSVVDSCDFAITNGNHGSTLRFLAQGLPVLTLPLFIEQRCTARRIHELGLGRMISIHTAISSGALVDEIQKLLACRTNVQRFAENRRNLLGADRIEAVWQRLQSML